MPEVSLVSPQVDDGRQFPHGPDVQLGRGDPLRDPQSRFSVSSKTLAPRISLKPKKIAIYGKYPEFRVVLARVQPLCRVRLVAILRG